MNDQLKPCPFCGSENISCRPHLGNWWLARCVDCGATLDRRISRQSIVDAWNRRPDRPTIVCLCGSTRFWRIFQEAGLQETLAGKIVLSIGAAAGTDDDHFGNLPGEEYGAIKSRLDELHLRKIDLADEILVLNVDGYIGQSTTRELAYADKLGKRIRFWDESKIPGIARIILSQGHFTK